MQVHLEIHVFQLSEEGAADDDEMEDDVSTYRDWQLPAQEFHNLWDSLIYEGDIKARLLQYASTVSPHRSHAYPAHLSPSHRPVLHSTNAVECSIGTSWCRLFFLGRVV